MVQSRSSRRSVAALAVAAALALSACTGAAPSQQDGSSSGAAGAGGASAPTSTSSSSGSAGAAAPTSPTLAAPTAPPLGGQSFADFFAHAKNISWEESVNSRRNTSTIHQDTDYGQPLVIGLTCEGPGRVAVNLKTSDGGDETTMERIDVPSCPSASTYVIQHWNATTLLPEFVDADTTAAKSTVSVGALGAVGDAAPITSAAGVTTLPRSVKDHAPLKRRPYGTIDGATYLDLWLPPGTDLLKMPVTVKPGEQLQVRWECDVPGKVTVDVTHRGNLLGLPTDDCTEPGPPQQLDAGYMAADATKPQTVSVKVSRKRAVGTVHVGIARVKG